MVAANFTQLERPKNAKDEVKKRPERPPAGSRGPEGLQDFLYSIFPIFDCVLLLNIFNANIWIHPIYPITQYAVLPFKVLCLHHEENLLKSTEQFQPHVTILPNFNWNDCANAQ